MTLSLITPFGHHTPIILVSNLYAYKGYLGQIRAMTVYPYTAVSSYFSARRGKTWTKCRLNVELQ